MKKSLFLILIIALNFTTFAQVDWKANWIWYPGQQKTINFNCMARRGFDVKGPITKARLHISVFTDYILYVNGQKIGRGPTPSYPVYQSYDTYNVEEYLKPGANSIAVACHNYGTGVHWQYAGPGGLICQLEIESPSGNEVIATDSSWKMKATDYYDLRTPRFFWSCGFAETFYSDLYDPKWKDTDYSAANWIAPEVLGRPPVRPWLHLIPREIPLIKEYQPEPPVALEKGTFKLSGVHTIRFDSLIAQGVNALGYAQTYFYAERDTDLVLKIESDDAYKCILNGKVVLEQNYLESEVRLKLWRGYDEYEQVHDGTTLGWNTKAGVKLHKGWNQLMVVVDQGVSGWGFCLSFSNPATKQVISLPFASDQKKQNDWQLAGPIPSTGFNNSLDSVGTDISNAKGGKTKFYKPFQYGLNTDYSMLMNSEERTKPVSINASAPLELKQGEFAIYDLGVVKAGFPVFQLNAEQGTVLDIGYSQVFFDDRRIRFSNDGMMKNVDRLYLKKGSQSWEPFERRTGRFIHLSCRTGKVKITNPGFRFWAYPVNDIATFQSSDSTLNNIWRVSRYTSKLLMRNSFEDCLKREQATFNTNQALYQYLAAAYCFGDQKLIRKCLKIAISTQQDDGWFHAHGPSSITQDEVTLDFYWLLLLKAYYQNSGDIDFVREVFPATEDMLRFFAKWTNRYGLLDGKNFVVQRPGQLLYIDDSQMNGNYVDLFHGETVGFNILYQDALSAAAELSAALNLKDRADFYHRKSERVKLSCNQRFWDQGKGLYFDWRLDNKLATTYHPVHQIESVYHGLSDSTQKARIVDYLLNDLGLPSKEKKDYPLFTFGYYYYFLEVLFENGMDKEALDLIRTYYGSWLKAGGTTFGEAYVMSALKNDKIDYEYEVHGYGTSAHAHFYTNILGIRPQTAGFKTVLLAPHPGNLAWAKGTVSTPQGLVDVSWKQEGTTFHLEAKLPAKCDYKLNMPANFAKYEVIINGKQVELGKPSKP